MRKSNQVFTGILILGVLIGAGLMFFNEELFNQMVPTPASQQSQTQPTNAAQNNSNTIQPSKESTTPYQSFTKAAYDRALQEKKVILLNFYANWCPICRAEEPDALAAFASLDNPQAIGFQVNFKDSETDLDEKALAELYQIPYQHTKVILVDGKQVLKETKQWNKQQFIDAVTAADN